MLGALPVVADVGRRLRTREIVDAACPIREVSTSVLTRGRVIEVFGVTADVLGDDRLGRALDAVADRLDHIVGSVGSAAIDAFGLDVTRMHRLRVLSEIKNRGVGGVTPFG